LVYFIQILGNLGNLIYTELLPVIIYIGRANKKTQYALQSPANNSSTVKVNFVIFCMSIERLHRHTFAKLYIAEANNEKNTVN